MSYRFYGALGFGIGGFIVGLSGDYMVFAFLLMGMLGSAFLTIPAKDVKLTVISSAFGGVGFFIGFAIPLFIDLTIYEFPFTFIVTGLFLGAIVGLLLGILFKSIKKFMSFGIIGCVISFGIIEFLVPSLPSFYQVIAMTVVGVIIGLFLGRAAMLAKGCHTAL